MDTNSHESGMSIMPRQPPQQQARIIWVMVGIGLFLVACIAFIMFMTFAKPSPIE